MPETVIHVENISKKYQLGKVVNTSLRDAFSSFIKPKQNGTEETFWALKDVSFEVKQGEVIGIIGKNGAGKSTLLKIISRITEPTSGRISITGRVASLLEVGTGFHPELTGRENIYLNGTILGMSRAEVKIKFDEIVDFSGVEKFIDTPVKHYSSGMYVRLAFAVAAHLDPEILLIDEVLAVGDAEFQKKCLGKMKDVAGEGRTVLFVSHNLALIKNLCKNTLLLSEGTLKLYCKTDIAIEHYQHKINALEKPIIEGSKLLQLHSFNILNKTHQKIETFNTLDEIFFKIQYTSTIDLGNVSFSICFNNSKNQRITSLWSAYYNKKFDITKGMIEVLFHIPSIKLIPDTYEIILFAESLGHTLERIDNFKKVIVGYPNIQELAQIPKYQQGVFVEEFNCKVKQNILC